MSILSAIAPLAVLAEETTPDPDTVTPGIIGFIVTFLVAVITVLLIIDMVRRVRRVNYRAQVRDELESELAAQKAAGSGDATTASGASGTDGPKA
ncbi:MAG: hypothetical protein EPO52_03080 [Herbiconiux sp.]|uniref:hypothetical protein n=1 Tax=Herbiconiux sp. TaxID=1871186 RepID=UPI00120C6572|nr:hypothetical protein [Herbiconiux sp.]TAJ49928.1 MAG: hypothetical protein EPO52_03080 [Herbiconiux sp.]